MANNISTNQAAYLRFIAAHPGCTTADVDRACRYNARAGHKWVYDGVGRLMRRGFVQRFWTRPESAKWGQGLCLTPKGEAKLVNR